MLYSDILEKRIVILIYVQDRTIQSELKCPKIVIRFLLVYDNTSSTVHLVMGGREAVYHAPIL